MPLAISVGCIVVVNVLKKWMTMTFVFFLVPLTPTSGAPHVVLVYYNNLKRNATSCSTEICRLTILCQWEPNDGSATARQIAKQGKGTNNHRTSTIL